MSKSNQTPAEALSILNDAATAFFAALSDFQEVYDPETVGINELCDSISECLFDIAGEIEDEDE